jgi:hypothetical protein
MELCPALGFQAGLFPASLFAKRICGDELSRRRCETPHKSRGTELKAPDFSERVATVVFGELVCSLLQIFQQAHDLF